MLGNCNDELPKNEQIPGRTPRLRAYFVQRAVPASAAMSVCERNSTAAALAGQGLMGVARDSYPRNGSTMSFCAAFAEVEVDVETGM